MPPRLGGLRHAGYLGALSVAFTTCVPLGLILIFSGVGVVISLLISDYYLLGAIAGGAILGILIGGFIGENSAKWGASAGVIGGMFCLGAYLMESQAALRWSSSIP